MNRWNLLLLLIIPCFTTCRKVQKNVNDYYPTVKTTAATILPAGAVRISGEIVSGGSDPIYYAGFCMDTLPHPDMISNQIISTDIQGNTFTADYTYLNTLKKYYFRSWAINANGYAYGNDIEVDKITLDTSIIPCHPALNTIMVQGNTTTTENVYHAEAPHIGTTTWDFTASSGSYSLDYSFSTIPTTGIYKTVEDVTSATSRTVKILVRGPMTFGTTINPGADVYVSQIDAATIEVSFCHIPMNYGGFTFYFTSRFRSPK